MTIEPGQRRGIRVEREGGDAVIRIPIDRVHGFRVMLQPCSCVAAKSNATSDIRREVDKRLARIQAGKDA